MSQSAPAFSVLYQYALVGAVGVAVLLIVLLCIRARAIERRRVHDMPMRALDDLERKPRLYDAYLDGHGGSWHEIMPVSLHPFGSWTPNPAKHTSIDTNPPAAASALSTVAMIIIMPSPSPPPQPRAPPDSSGERNSEDDEPLPYLEFGVTDVERPPYADRRARVEDPNFCVSVVRGNPPVMRKL
ncbi:hypothetical protein K438DRAFT_2020902 [Mycena galopus ATCC 62051]|nr:hypothetical protein K438DRAFT_2020902 [Mycena galopus ATCC 62051]